MKKILLTVLLFTMTTFGQRIVESGEDYSDVSILAVKTQDGQAALLLRFEGTDAIHYYADAKDAPGNMPLEISLTTPEGIAAGNPLWPQSHPYYDKALEKNIQVYSGSFDVVIPLDCDDSEKDYNISVRIHGLACTDNTCMRFDNTLPAAVDMSKLESFTPITIKPQQKPAAQLSTVIETKSSGAVKYFLLAILAGLSFNIMPCVWPVLPLAVQRLVNFSAGSRKTLLLHGISFSAGILAFFVLFAAVSITLKLTTGAALDWSQHLRYPAVIAGMGLLLIVLAMFMFDMFIIGVPASIASKSGGNGTFSGSVGMGFLAAILSTPCSGAILAAVLVWAQTQTLLISTVAILLLGAGMMMPYLILANSPSMLKKLPKPGNWMDIFRKSMGFVLLIIAVKLILALPERLLGGVCYFAVVLCFAVWMWGGWVNMLTPLKRKIAIRSAAILLLVIAGFSLLKPQTSAISWKAYDKAAIDSLVSQNKPVLIKFTAKWCTNCHYLDRKVYSQPEVAQAINNKSVAAFIADTTSFDDPATADLKSVYNEPGSVPVSVIIMPDGSQKKLRGVFEKNDILEILESM